VGRTACTEPQCLYKGALYISTEFLLPANNFLFSHFVIPLNRNVCVFLAPFCLLPLNLSYPKPGAGIAQSVFTSRYGLDGPEIESRWGRDFLHLSRPALRPTQPPVQWVPGFSRGKERPGRDADNPPPPSAEVKETVELYLYSPSGPSCPFLG
jgi:hypothetical protein